MPRPAGCLKGRRRLLRTRGRRESKGIFEKNYGFKEGFFIGGKTSGGGALYPRNNLRFRKVYGTALVPDYFMGIGKGAEHENFKGKSAGGF